MYYLLLGVLLGVAACSSTRNQGTPQAYRPMADDNYNRSKDHYQANQSLASWALISGVGMLFEKRKAPPGILEGSCRVRTEPQANIHLACENTEIVLLDLKGNEISRAITTDGTFSFAVKGKKRFKLRVNSKNLKLSPDVVGPVGEHDTVSLELSPR